MTELEQRLQRQLRRVQLGIVVVIIIALVTVTVIFVPRNVDLENEFAVVASTLTSMPPTLTAANSQVMTAEWQAMYLGVQQAWIATYVPGLGALPPVTGTRVPEDFLATVTAVAELNAWTPIIREFEGVEMMQVNAGCFFMGSSAAFSEEQPVHEICFAEPFWIDRYEVTNAQFEAFDGEAAQGSGSTGPNRLPHVSVTWFEARDFCELRGARLPTEAEWEYAARGPDSLVYPWGNEFVGDNVVYSGNMGPVLAEVGSRPGGISWVGAHDMSGSVWEWVSSAYEDYPYNPDDGREDLDKTDVERVLRGGWFGLNMYGLRAAYRYGEFPLIEHPYIGFRCALSE